MIFRAQTNNKKTRYLAYLYGIRELLCNETLTRSDNISNIRDQIQISLSTASVIYPVKTKIHKTSTKLMLIDTKLDIKLPEIYFLYTNCCLYINSQFIGKVQSKLGCSVS